MTSDPKRKPRSRPAWLPAALPAGAAVVLLVLHFVFDGAEPAPAPVKVPKAKTDWTAAREAEQARRDAWRERNKPSVLDDAEARQAKDFNRTMTALGITPVEVIDASDSSRPALVVVDTPAQMRDLLKNGDHYSGPLPDGFFDEPEAAKPAADAAAGTKPTSANPTNPTNTEKH